MKPVAVNVKVVKYHHRESGEEKLGYNVTTGGEGSPMSEHKGMEYTRAAELIAYKAHISELTASKLLDVATALVGYDRSVTI